MCGCTGNLNFAATPNRMTILRKPAEVNGAPRSEVKMMGETGSCSRLSWRKARTAGNGMDSWRTILGSIDVQSTVTEVDSVPTQGHKLAYPQAMPIGDQDHGGVAVAMAVAAGGDD